MSDEVPGATAPRSTLERALVPLLSVVGLVMTARWITLLATYLGEVVLFANENTLRDYEVYARFRQGLVPLQGPITSIGGNHGWLASWFYGAAQAVVPEATTPMVVSLAAVVAGWLVGVALVRHLVPGLPTVVGALLVPATHLPLLLCFPSHISFILLGVSLTFLGAARAREGAGWALAATVGVVIAIGAHRTGWGVLAALALFDWRLGLGVFRHRIAWVPLALYAVPELVVAWLGGAPTPVTDGRAEVYFTQVAPWNVLRAIPFASPPTPELEPLQIAQLVLVLVTLALARGGLDSAPARAAWWFYVVGAVVLLGFPEDEQYYIPLLAVLPLLGALATREAARRGTGALLGWSVLLLVVVGGSNAMVTTDLREQFGDEEGIRSVLPELAVADALAAQGITAPELWERTLHAPANPAESVAYLLAITHDLAPAAPEPPRCFHVARQDEVQGRPGWEPVGPTWALRVTTEEPCPGTVHPYESPIWYWDVWGGGVVAR